MILLPRSELLDLHHQASGLAQAITQHLTQVIQGLKARPELQQIRSARTRVLHSLNSSTAPDQPLVQFEMPLKMWPQSWA